MRHVRTGGLTGRRFDWGSTKQPLGSSEGVASDLSISFLIDQMGEL